MAVRAGHGSLLAPKYALAVGGKCHLRMNGVHFHTAAPIIVRGGGDMQIGDLIKQARVFSSYTRSVASVLETGWMQQLIAVVGLLTLGRGQAKTRT